MTNRKNRFNLFNDNLFKSKLNKFGVKNKLKSNKLKSNKLRPNKLKSDRSNDTGENSSYFPSFESIIPENSPLNKNSGSDTGFYNDKFSSKNNSKNDFHGPDDLEGVDEKYAKYIYSNDSRESDYLDEDDFHQDFDIGRMKSNESNVKESGRIKNMESNEKDLKKDLLDFKKNLLNKKDSSKSFFGKVTVILIFLVLVSSIFYFFVYQPFQNELSLERNAKLNEVHALYKGPLELNDNAYTLEDKINHAYDIEEIKSIDVVRYATKDWRVYHSSKIVSNKDDFGRVMMSYGEDKNIIMSVNDANAFIKDNDARILSNVKFEKVNTVIVPISLSRLQATAGLISVGSVVDVYSLNDSSSEFPSGYEDDDNPSSPQLNETPVNNTLEMGKENAPMVSGATVLAILRSKDSGLVDSTVSKSNTIIKGNDTKPFENTSSFSSDVEELLKAAALSSSNDDNALDSYLTNYGVRLSNFERMSNLGDLDSEYIILLEVPQSDVNFVINNMDNLILTIPTEFAPNWVVDELNETYYENLYPDTSINLL